MITYLTAVCNKRIFSRLDLNDETGVFLANCEIFGLFLIIMELEVENIVPIKPSPHGKGRKKLLQPEKHKRNVEKLARYVP